MLTVTEAYNRGGYGQLKFHCGQEWCGPCPSCGGNDRFVIYTEQREGQGTYFCRHCRLAGDLISFLREFEGMDYKEACEACGVPTRSMPRHKTPAAPKPAKKTLEVAPTANPAELWGSRAEKFAQWSHKHLLANTDAAKTLRNWLAARGLPLEAVKQYGLGLNVGDGKKPCLMRPRKVWGLDDAPPNKEGGEPRKTLWLPRGLVIPSTENGEIKRLRIRRDDADRNASLPDLKYYIVPGSAMQPLWLEQNGDTLKRGTAVVIVESELDAMAVHYACGHMVGVLGIMTAKIKAVPQHVMTALKNASIILVATDTGDASGAGTEGWHVWRDTFSHAQRLVCVGGKDPGEMAQAGQSLLLWLLSALPRAMADVAMHKMSAQNTLAEPITEPAPEQIAEPPAEPIPEPPAEPIPEPPRPVEYVRYTDDGRKMTKWDLRKEAQAMYPLENFYIGHELVLDVLAAHGVSIGPDGCFTGHENWPIQKLSTLFGFSVRHRRQLDAIINKMLGVS